MTQFDKQNRSFAIGNNFDTRIVKTTLSKLLTISKVSQPIK